MARTQTPGAHLSEGDSIEYSPAAAVYGGDTVLSNSLVAHAPLDIDASASNGSLQVSGRYNMPKDGSVFRLGDRVYWNPTGDPTGGTAGTGCFTLTALGNIFAGIATAAAATGAALVEMIFVHGSRVIPPCKFTTDATGTQTADAGDLTGADVVVWKNTANGAVALTTRTAAQMYADIPGAQIGQTFLVRIISAGDNTVTLTAGTGITITGTATVATAKFRDFHVTIVSATAMTFQDIGAGTT